MKFNGHANLTLSFLAFQFQSHQIFHMFVLAAALVHFHGISKIANYRLSLGECLDSELVEY